MENEHKIFYHDHGDGVIHAHEAEPEHAHDHSHPHTHDHTQTKAVVNRLARAEVLIQLAAVRSALSSTAKIILKDHIEHCISGAEGDREALEELNDAIDKFI